MIKIKKDVVFELGPKNNKKVIKKINKIQNPNLKNKYLFIRQILKPTPNNFKNQSLKNNQELFLNKQEAKNCFFIFWSKNKKTILNKNYKLKRLFLKEPKNQYKLELKQIWF